MKLSSAQIITRLLLGVAAWLPFLLVAMLLLPRPGWLPRLEWTLRELWGALALVLPIVGYFLFRLWRLETISNRSKTLWTLRIFLTGGFTLPMFWYFFVWKAETYAQYELEDYERDIDLIGTDEEPEDDEGD